MGRKLRDNKTFCTFRGITIRYFEKLIERPGYSHYGNIVEALIKNLKLLQ